MKRTFNTVFLIILSMLFVKQSYAEYWIKYDPSSTPPNQITRYNADCTTVKLCTGPNHDGLQANVFEATEPEFNLAGASFKKADPLASPGSRVIDWSATEINDLNTAQAASTEASLRSGSISQFDGQNTQALGLRCLTKVVLDEINVVRDWTKDFKVEVAAATNLANLQTRVATLPTLNDRTLAQAKTAIANCVNNLEADE